MPPGADQFRIRRFRGLDGEDITIYGRLVKVRPGEAAAFHLYEDNRGGQWLEICQAGQSALVRLAGETFEQRVAQELLTLGLNKYSG